MAGGGGLEEFPVSVGLCLPHSRERETSTWSDRPHWTPKVVYGTHYTGTPYKWSSPRTTPLVQLNLRSTQREGLYPQQDLLPGGKDSARIRYVPQVEDREHGLCLYPGLSEGLSTANNKVCCPSNPSEVPTAEVPSLYRRSWSKNGRETRR